MVGLGVVARVFRRPAGRHASFAGRTLLASRAGPSAKRMGPAKARCEHDNGHEKKPWGKTTHDVSEDVRDCCCESPKLARCSFHHFFPARYTGIQIGHFGRNAPSTLQLRGNKLLPNPLLFPATASVFPSVSRQRWSRVGPLRFNALAVSDHQIMTACECRAFRHRFLPSDRKRCLGT